MCIRYLIGQLKKSVNYRAVASNDEGQLQLLHYLKLCNDAPESFGDSGIWLGPDKRINRPIKANQTCEVLVQRWQSVLIVKTFTAELGNYGWQGQAQNKLKVAMHYVLINDAASGLSRETLPYGDA